MLEASWALPAHRIVSGLGFPVPESSVALSVTYTIPDLAMTLRLRLYAEATYPFFGGRRWWWKCGCGRRVAALFLPPVCATDFRCRHCHGLAYRSTQQHDSRVDYYRAHPEAAIAVLLDGTLDLRRFFLVLRSRTAKRGGLRTARMPSVSL